ncbi:MAG: hypothetical protein ACXWP0_01245 [Ktedonobacterales bacterium]
MRQTCSMCGATLLEIEKAAGVCYACDVKVDQTVHAGFEDWKDIDTHTARVIARRVKTLLDTSLDVSETLLLWHDDYPIIYATLNLDTVGRTKVIIREDQIRDLVKQL